MLTTTMNQPLDWLLWWTLHLFFTIFLAIGTAFSSIKRILTSATDSGSAAGEGQATGANGFKEKVKGVAVAVVFENLQGLEWEGKVSQLISWFSAINVSHVTLFDPAGVLKRSQSQLETTLKVLDGTGKDPLEADEQDYDNSRQQSAKNSQLLGELSDLRKRKGEYVNGEYRGSTGGEECRMIVGGMSKVRRSEMEVEILSLHDGKESLVKAAKTVCENAYKLHYAKHHQSKLPKLTEQDVKESLQVNGIEGPDPDLLLLFGKTRSLHGFPPWRLRLTEIVHMGPLQDMSASSLVAALKEFSKKTHRYGR